MTIIRAASRKKRGRKTPCKGLCGELKARVRYLEEQIAGEQRLIITISGARDVIVSQRDELQRRLDEIAALRDRERADIQAAIDQRTRLEESLADARAAAAAAIAQRDQIQVRAEELVGRVDGAQARERLIRERLDNCRERFDSVRAIAVVFAALAAAKHPLERILAIFLNDPENHTSELEIGEVIDILSEGATGYIGQRCADAREAPGKK